MRMSNGLQQTFRLFGSMSSKQSGEANKGTRYRVGNLDIYLGHKGPGVEGVETSILIEDTFRTSSIPDVRHFSVSIKPDIQSKTR